MAPSATETHNGHDRTHAPQNVQSVNTLKAPLTSNRALDNYSKIELTPGIGTEFPTANLVDIMNAPNSDELLTELAYISMLRLPILHNIRAHTQQSLLVVSSGSASKTTSPTNFRKSSSSASARPLVVPRRLTYTSTPSSTARATSEKTVIQTKQSAPFPPNSSERFTT